MTTTTKQEIFGTDGIRGKALEGWLAPAAVEALGRAAGAVLARDAQGLDPSVLIAHDGRGSAGALESALARGFAEAGLESVSAGLLPTPGLAWLTSTRRVTLGAMISASHNPAEDNGIKLFAGGGAKLTDSQQKEIEQRLREEAAKGASNSVISAVPDPTVEADYIGHLVHLAQAGEPLDLTGAKIVVDCAHGAASRVGPQVLAQLGAEVDVLHASPDGENINRDCGSTCPETLQARVREIGADVGIALDGDADRCIMVDNKGELVDGDGIMAILGRDAAHRKLWPDLRIVATIMSNRGLHRALAPVGVEIEEVGVGDRQVVEGLKAHGLELGGEKSGHIIFGESNDFIGDGLLTALHVLGVRARTGESLAELVAPFVPFPQVLLGLQVASKPPLEGLPEFQALKERHEAELAAAGGRVNVRYSGTEPKARVMVEGPDENRIQAMADELVAVLEREIAAQ